MKFKISVAFINEICRKNGILKQKKSDKYYFKVFLAYYLHELVKKKSFWFHVVFAKKVSMFQTLKREYLFDIVNWLSSLHVVFVQNNLSDFHYIFQSELAINIIKTV